jgi:hypothetical protein
MTIVSLRPQLSAPGEVTASVVAGPPDVGTFFSVLSMKNAIH